MLRKTIYAEEYHEHSHSLTLNLWPWSWWKDQRFFGEDHRSLSFIILVYLWFHLLGNKS